MATLNEKQLEDIKTAFVDYIEYYDYKEIIKNLHDLYFHYTVLLFKDTDEINKSVGVNLHDFGHLIKILEKGL